MTELHSLLEDAIARGVAPGLAAAVTTMDAGEVIATAGMRGLDDATPLTPDTIFYIASCTKIVTSVAALQLVERGLLSLDEPVGRHLPELARPSVLIGFDESGAPRTRAARTDVTLRHLLTHTSGLAYDFTSADLTRYISIEGLDVRTAEPPPLPLVFEPGEGWIYGTGLDWTGRLIEAVCGQPLEDHFRSNIFEPLGMSDTSFFPSEEQTRRRASVQFRGPEGGLSVLAFGMPPTRHFWMGGAGLYSTIGDYMRFLRTIAEGGAPLLGPSLFRSMFEDVEGPPTAGWIETADPLVSSDYRPLSGLARRHGLAGLVNLQPAAGGREAGSLHWAGATNCYYWVDPQAKAAGVVMSQVLPFADPAVIAVFDDIERNAYAERRTGSPTAHQGAGDP